VVGAAPPCSDVRVREASLISLIAGRAGNASGAETARSLARLEMPSCYRFHVEKVLAARRQRM
jgi:hypothetical protein